MAAFYPLAFAAEQIAGGSVEVRNLTPAGAEPHDLELTPSDVRAVHDASLVLYLGDGFMPGLETAVKQRQGRSLDVLAELRQQAGYGGGAAGDPHVWLDPVRYAEMVRLIGSALGDEAPAARLARRLDALDGEYRRGLAHCARRQIVTSHAAFGYLAARYGLEQIPLEGLTPEAEPSARDIARLVDVVRSSGATTVFFETLISPKLAETVAREAHVRDGRARPARGDQQERDRCRSRLLLGHAGEPRHPAEGAGMHELSDPVVELDGVSFGYRAGVRVLEDVSLAVAAGEFVAIAGPNGGGKTTLLRLVLGLERPSEGTVRVFGQAGRQGRRRRPHRLPPAAVAAPRRGPGDGARDRLHRQARSGGHLGAAAPRRPRGRRACDRDRRARATGPTHRCARSPAGCSSER